MLDKDTAKAIVVALEFRERALKESPGNEHGVLLNDRALGIMRQIERGDMIASLWSVEDIYSLHTNDDGELIDDISPETVRRVRPKKPVKINVRYFE